MKFCLYGGTVMLKNGNILFTTVLKNVRVYGICLFDLVIILNVELQSLQLKNLTFQRNRDHTEEVK